ncbi:MAG: hypothetical protein QME66_04980 [Candidatus Eisenbacteria bacterium]|nr:hypothetical protein [Candidatus Eisenbacteria bacterium]
MRSGKVLLILSILLVWVYALCEGAPAKKTAAQSPRPPKRPPHVLSITRASYTLDKCRKLAADWGAYAGQHPDEVRAWVEWGRALEICGDREQSEQKFRRAIEIDSTDAACLVVSVSLGDQDFSDERQVQWIQKRLLQASLSDPGYAETYPILMMASARLNDMKTARAALEKMASLGYISPVLAEYAYNMMAPLEKNAILFTNGDNDTYPLWYLQEVRNLRRDVRVVNLSLLNVPWYIKQVKYQKPEVPISMSDGAIDSLAPYENENSEFVFIKDIMVKHILETNEARGSAKLPIYLAATVPDQIGLTPRLSLEGLVLRVLSDEVGPNGKVDAEKMKKNLYEVFKYDSLYTKNRRYDESVFGEDPHFGLARNNYAAAHVRLAWQLREAEKMDEAVVEMEAASKIDPYFQGVVGWLGIFYEAVGSFDKARDHYRSMLKKFGNDPQLGPQIRFKYAVMLERTGQRKSAIVELEKVCKSVQSGDAVKALGVLYWEDGRKAEAVGILKKWVRDHPDDKDAQEMYNAYSGMLTSEEAAKKPAAKPTKRGKP